MATTDFSGRQVSLDVFRGLTVAFMILVNNPGSWSNLYAPLQHAPWHGWTPTDLVFPFFLFAVGNTLAFAVQGQAGTPDAGFHRRVLKRAALIFGIGLFLNWSPFVRWEAGDLVWRSWVHPVRPDSGIRIMGVLQRIALAYAVAAFIAVRLTPKATAWISGLMLSGYWALCLLAGHAGDPYSLEGYFGTTLDRTVFGAAHLYKGEGVPFDPEGLGGVLSSTVSVLIGYNIAVWMRLGRGRRLFYLQLLAVALLLIAGGLLWDPWFPINKKLWTSSYVLLSSGMAILALAALDAACTFRQQAGRWVQPWLWFGRNPLFLFALSGFLPRFLGLFRWQTGLNESGEPVFTSLLPWLSSSVFLPLHPDLRIGSLAFALFHVAFFGLIAWLMHRKRWYLRV